MDIEKHLELKNIIGLSVNNVKKLFPRCHIRIINVGQIITMDYSPTRINLWLNNHKHILKATFG